MADGKKNLLSVVLKQTEEQAELMTTPNPIKGFQEVVEPRSRASSRFNSRKTWGKSRRKLKSTADETGSDAAGRQSWAASANQYKENKVKKWRSPRKEPWGTPEVLKEAFRWRNWEQSDLEAGWWFVGGDPALSVEDHRSSTAGKRCWWEKIIPGVFFISRWPNPGPEGLPPCLLSRSIFPNQARTENLTKTRIRKRYRKIWEDQRLVIKAGQTNSKVDPPWRLKIYIVCSRGSFFILNLKKRINVAK